MTQVFLKIVSAALLVFSAALLFAGNRFPEYQFSEYLSNDAEALARMEDGLTTDRADWPAAVRLFRSAVRRDASSAQLWCQLGEATAKTGDFRTAEYCYLRGAALGPRSPKILLDLGDFYFNAHLYRKSLPWFSALLKTIEDPADGYVLNTFEYYEGMDVRGNNWLDEAIPGEAAARSYLVYLTGKKEAQPLSGLWEWCERRGFLTDEMTVRYTDYLVHHHEGELAAGVWANRFRGRGYGCVGPNCVFNGDFEHAPTGGFFDWSLPDGNGVKAERDQVSRYEGQYSLRLDFRANDNPDFHQIQEVVPIQPGRYRLEGFIRTSGITSDEGIRLRVTGAKNLRAETNAVGGTEAWRRVQADFDTPAEVREVQVAVARRKSLRIDNQLSGTAWIDSVRLTKIR